MSVYTKLIKSFIANSVYVLEITIVATILFAIYVEISPGMGNIWYRLNSDGYKEIRIINLIHIMLAPLTNSFYWWPIYWDINFFVYWFIVYMMYLYI